MLQVLSIYEDKETNRCVPYTVHRISNVQQKYC